jgi:2-polyprenyl-6-methoxyphenol hydroxylase-like FAD-dependent oxidoreductase
MKIGIVGGSIAGCSAANLFMKKGYDVSVFERSQKALVGRGGGIGTIPSLLNEIANEGMIGRDFASIHISKLPFIGKNPSAEPFGKRAGAIDMNFEVFQWNELWKHLRMQIPDKIYHAGTKVMDAVMDNKGKVTLSFDKGPEQQFDLVIFADGYDSLGRSILFPEKHLKYRGYVLWRGLLPEAEMEERSPLKDEILRLSYNGQPGHNVLYFIPSENGSVMEGERIFNWAAYIAIPENELDEVMTDKTGRKRKGTLPQGMMRDRTEARLKSFLSEHTPDYYAGIVNKTRNSYIQVIYTLELESYYKDKMLLIGDAGMVVQPFTGSGVFKGYNNVKDLVACLNDMSPVEYAIDKWSEIQINTGKRLLALGEQMEKAFIWEQPDFAVMDEDSTAAWWKDSITFPENFNYEKG